MNRNKLWKILKETKILDYLTCLLRNLHAGQEATVRTGHGTMDWLKIGKVKKKKVKKKKLGKYIKTVYCHPAYLTYIQSITCKMPGWMKHKLESKFPRETSITSDMQMISPLWQKVKRN